MENILIKPLVTEKMTAQTEKYNRVGFLVDKRANKIEIKKAVESHYNVKVIDVNTISYAGKVKSRYTKAGFIEGRTNAFKKAIITLEKGSTIDFYSSI
ncbi:50S ribosomal protein L23 [Bacteroidia bacterium]|nr:50S ribosomal protein L23 [Bacteroidia bacterium]